LAPRESRQSGWIGVDGLELRENVRHRGNLVDFLDPRSPQEGLISGYVGVDAPTCKNVVLARVIGSMSEFKQIIGRGTRVRDDYGKVWFNILDYTGSATRLFTDPSFEFHAA
jgi:hypothetical protein